MNLHFCILNFQSLKNSIHSTRVRRSLHYQIMPLPISARGQMGRIRFMDQTYSACEQNVDRACSVAGRTCPAHVPNILCPQADFALLVGQFFCPRANFDWLMGQTCSAHRLNMGRACSAQEPVKIGPWAEKSAYEPIFGPSAHGL